MDGRIDGQFTIKQGGITQGIAKELGLSSAECKQMGSIWNQVLAELNNSDNYIIENNGKNNQNNSLTVQAGAIVKFTKDCWQKIVDIVNNALNKNLTTKYTPSSYDDMPSQDFANTKDARGLYLDKLNLTEEQLLSLTIDSTTVLSEEQQAILDKVKENTMNPGLNIRSLHEQGITGKGVRIAIIDSDINDNPEFKDRVISQTNFAQNKDGVYHGNVVSSVAVGKECGVAPDAELAFYSASTLTEHAKAIDNIIAKNEEYKQKGEPVISVISISCGFDVDKKDKDNNYKNLRRVIAKAKKAGIAVITNDPKKEYKHFAGADRNPKADPNDKNSYRMDRFRRDGEWWNDKKDKEKNQTIFVPTEHRTVADEYDGYRYEGNFGGDSWGAPYIAGVFALAKQVKPDVTYEQFYDIMQKTADKMNNYDTGTYAGKLINPKGIIEYLQNMN